MDHAVSGRNPEGRSGICKVKKLNAGIKYDTLQESGIWAVT